MQTLVEAFKTGYTKVMSLSADELDQKRHQPNFTQTVAFQHVSTAADGVPGENLTGVLQGKLLTLLSQVEQMSGDAALEPRYSKCPWPAAFAEHVIKCSRSLRVYLRELEHAEYGSDGTCDFILTDVHDVPSFKKAKDELLVLASMSNQLVMQVLKNEKGEDKHEVIKEALKVGGYILSNKKGVDFDTVVEDLTNTGKFQYPNEVEDTLEDDKLCRISVMLMTLENASQKYMEMVNECIDHL